MMSTLLLSDGLLQSRRAVILRDERPGYDWVRGSNNESNSFLDRIRKRGLPGVAARRIDRNEEEWARLVEIIAVRISNFTHVTASHIALARPRSYALSSFIQVSASLQMVTTLFRKRNQLASFGGAWACLGRYGFKPPVKNATGSCRS